MASNNVFFKVGTKAQYTALTTKDANTLYWLTDTQELYKGDTLYGIGAAASATAAGLMSAEDKSKLDGLTAVEAVVISAADASVTVADTDEGKSIKLNISAESGNAIYLKSDGLFAQTASVAESGSVKTVTTVDQPYSGAAVGDVYIDLVLDSANDKHVYVPASDLVDEVSAGNGVEVTNNTVSVKLDSANANGLAVGASGLSLSAATTSAAGAMSATDKSALDTAVSDITTIKESIVWGTI